MEATMDLFDTMLFEDSSTVQFDEMWDELDMCEETGDLDAMDRVFAKYHWNFVAATPNREVHTAWAVV
jgi:hypothetical protein